MPVKNRIQLRRGTSAEWSGSVDILASGEMGWDTTENNIKIGDGSNYWDDLPWLIVAGVSGQVINPTVVSGVSGIFLDTSVGDVDLIAGQVGWNSEAGTAEIGLTNDLKIQIGQTVLFRVKNSTGGALSKGQAVYASGVLGGGQIIQAAPFAVDGTVDEVRFIGLMTDDLANGEDGYVSHFGHIKNVDLRSTNTTINPNGETWAVGDILFVDDTTAGGLTKVPPQDDIYVAMVLADGQNGELFVRITDPGHITDLHDVNTSGLVDNNLLVWNSGADYWEPSNGLYYVDGEFSIGNPTPTHQLTINTTNKDPDSAMQSSSGSTASMYSEGGDLPGLLISMASSNSYTHRGSVYMNRSRGTLDTPLAVQSGDWLGSYYGAGYDGAALRRMGGVIFLTDGDVSSGSLPTSIIFQTGSTSRTEKMRIKPDGNIGIGTAYPSTKLDVAGSGNFSGDVSVDGHLSASTKSFLIDHPTKKGKKLQYGSLESPYHGVRLTGRDKLKEGVCIIKLPSYMKKLVREEDISIQITNYKHHKTLYVDDIDLSKNQIIIKGHRCKTLGELEFFWSFTAIRKDVPELVVEK